jgi:hypothetical protein
VEVAHSPQSWATAAAHTSPPATTPTLQHKQEEVLAQLLLAATSRLTPETASTRTLRPPRRVTLLPPATATFALAVETLLLHHETPTWMPHLALATLRARTMQDLKAMMVFLAAGRLVLTWRTCSTTTVLVHEFEVLAFDFLRFLCIAAF